MEDEGVGGEGVREVDRIYDDFLRPKVRCLRPWQEAEGSPLEHKGKGWTWGAGDPMLQGLLPTACKASASSSDQ